VAESAWNGWPDVHGISGRIAVDWVAECAWNQWPNNRGIRSNNSSKSKLTLLEDINFDRQSYTGNILNMVKIHFLSDEYEKILEDRKKTFSALAEKAEAGKDAKAKKDM